VTDWWTHAFHIIWYTVVVPRASIISESEVSITVLCLQCSSHYAAVWIKNYSKSTSVNKGSHYEKYNGAVRPSLSSETKVSISLPCQLCSTRYIAIQINNCLKSTSVIKVATMKNTDDSLGTISVTQSKPSRATTKSTLFTVSKDEWNKKEDTGKPLKDTLHVLRYAKRHLSGWSDVKQWKR